MSISSFIIALIYSIFWLFLTWILILPDAMEVFSVLVAYLFFNFSEIVRSQLTASFTCTGDFFAFGLLAIADSGVILLIKRNIDIPFKKSAIFCTVTLGIILGLAGFLSTTHQCSKDSDFVFALIQLLFIFTLTLKVISYIPPRKGLSALPRARA